MAKKELLRLIRLLDLRLTQKERLILCGGMAVALAYGGKRETIDFDIIAPVPLNPKLKTLAKKIADEEGYSDDWLNDSCKGFASYLPQDWEDRLISIDSTFKNIKLFCLGKPDLLMLKLKAAREQDLLDIETIGISQEDVQIISKNLERISKFDNKGALTIKLFLEERGHV